MIMGTVSDISFLKTFTAGDPVKIKKYVGMFLNMAAPSLEQMGQYCQNSDWNSLKTTSHSLKSQMKYMGMTEAAILAQKIEDTCGNSIGLEEIPGLLSNLRSLVETATVELQEEVGRL